MSPRRIGPSQHGKRRRQADKLWDLCGYTLVDYRRPSQRAAKPCVARGCSAVGSASPCQGEGRGFESRHPLEGCSGINPAVEWPSGEATACKAVHTGSIPVSTSTSAISSAGERFPDTEEVTGSIPVSRTTFVAGQRQFLGPLIFARGRYVDDWVGVGGPAPRPQRRRSSNGRRRRGRVPPRSNI
jgi:hypothetical protein